jgi:hypothetical protein
MGIGKLVNDAYKSVKQFGKDLWSIHPYNTIKTYVKAISDKMYNKGKHYEPKPEVQAQL